MTDAREPAAESTSILEQVHVSRRGFLLLGICGMAGLSLFGALGCGASQDDGDDSGNEDGGKKEGNDEDDGGGGGAGGY